MFDKFGRLLCPTCGEPMTRAAKFDSHRGGVMRTAFACESLRGRDDAYGASVAARG